MGSCQALSLPCTRNETILTEHALFTDDDALYLKYIVSCIIFARLNLSVFYCRHGLSVIVIDGLCNFATASDPVSPPHTMTL